MLYRILVALYLIGFGLFGEVVPRAITQSWPDRPVKFVLPYAPGGAEEYAESAPWVAIYPGLAMTLAVFGFNLFGDAVRDALDPKLRSV